MLAALVVSLLPLLDPESSAEVDSIRPGAALAAERDRLVAALKDIDMDLAMGKVSEADHATMKSSLEGQLVGVLASLEESSA